ncbi:MAG: hypothetical protein EOO90_06310 [Pedobacter sp.]|nr:MAG: hypothetical protein EOO90_06310 [Pedobacter sp.]
MKKLIFFLLFVAFAPICRAQKKALNIAGIHQLVEHSKSENNLQKQARNHQSVTSANEDYNKTLLAKLKGRYRQLQERYHFLGLAINAANIGVYASPMVSRIVQNQMAIYKIAKQSPELITLAYQSELGFAGKSRSLINYLMGLCASAGAINQMKASDRKILFDHILLQISVLQDLSNNLLSAMQRIQAVGLLRSANPFQDFIDQDKAIVEDIIRNAKY